MAGTKVIAYFSQCYCLKCGIEYYGQFIKEEKRRIIAIKKQPRSEGFADEREDMLEKHIKQLKAIKKRVKKELTGTLISQQL